MILISGGMLASLALPAFALAPATQTPQVTHVTQTPQVTHVTQVTSPVALLAAFELPSAAQAPLAARNFGKIGFAGVVKPKLKPVRRVVVLPVPKVEASPTPDSEASPTPDSEVSPAPDRENSPTPDGDASPMPDSEASPTPDSEVSPAPDRENSPTPDNAASARDSETPSVRAAAEQPRRVVSRSTTRAPIAPTPTSTPTRTSTPTAKPRPEAPVAAPAPRSGGVLGIAAGLSGIDYVYGGTTVAGFDCSGFTQYVFNKVGISLPRTAEQQREATTPVTTPQPGDLVFFGNPAHHNGIYAGDGKIWDSPRTGKAISLRDIWTSSGVTYGRP